MNFGQADLVDRWPAAAPFVLAGTACVIAGGLLAAVTAHDPTRHGVWAVAYLVLVGGVAQLALGIGQAIFTREPPGQAMTWVEFIGFSAGNAGVIAGTLAGQTWLVDTGSVLLAAALILFLRSVLGAPRSVPVLVYQGLIVFVLGSIPVGLVLARM